MVKKFSLSIALLAVTAFGSGITLQKGWNLVGALENIEPSKIKEAKYVWSWNNNQWYSYSKDNLVVGYPKLTIIKKGAGFWVYATENGVIDNFNTEILKQSFDINNYPKSTYLSQDLKNSLAYMGNEERLAYDVYHNLYDYHITNSAMQIEQLKNISERAEIKHIEIVQNLVRKYNLNSDELSDIVNPVADNTIAIDSMPSGEYDIETIQILYNALYSKGITSQKDALEVGCMVEVTDINDLDNYIKMAQDSKADDVIQSFEILRDGSYSHYWAFDKGLKNIGISDGCCSLGKVDGVDYCHNEYPTHEHNEDGEHNIDTVEQQHIDTHQENKKGKEEQHNIDKVEQQHIDTYQENKKGKGKGGA